MKTPETQTSGNAVSFIEDTTSVTGPSSVPSPFFPESGGQPPAETASNSGPVFGLDVDHVSPLSEATYDPMTGELYLLFDYDRLLDTNGEWWAGRHIDAVTISGDAYPLVIHDDAGPRDDNGNYIFDRDTVFNEFTLNIGAERMGIDGMLEFGFTDKEDGGGDTYYTFSLKLDHAGDGELPVEVTEQEDEGTEQVDEVTEQEDEATEQVDEVTEQVDEVTEQVDEVTEQVDEVTEQVDEVVEQPDGLVLAVNSGGEEFTASNGVTYQADTFGEGHAFSTGAEIAGTENDTLYQSEIWNEIGFHYEIEVENGVYDLELNFAEIWGGADGEGKRVFEIAVEDSLVTLPVDIYAEAGLNAAFDLIGQVEVTDGALTISALNLVQNSKISGFSLWEASGDLNEAFEAGSFSGVSDLDPPEANIVTLTEGDDRVVITEAADEIQALGGNDHVTLYADAGLVDLGEGNNTLNLVANATVGEIIAGSGNDRVVSRSDLGTIDTGDGDDTLLLIGDVELADAGDGANTVSLIGNGTVEAGSGADEIAMRGDGFVSSGLGNDTIDFTGNGLVYSGFNAAPSADDNDTVNFKGTGTLLTFGGDDTVNFAGYGRVDTGFGNDTVTVNEASADVVDTEGVGVTIETLFGDDRVIVNAEADMIRVFEGDNAVQINAHVEEVSAGSGDDLVTVYDTGSAGTIDLGGGNNVVTAFGDIGSVVTGDGSDRVESRAGAEIGTIQSGGGNDLLFVFDSFDAIEAGTGNDTINLSQNGSGVVYGGFGNDNVSSNGAAVDFFGEAGDDTFRFTDSATGPSRFDGGEGMDRLALIDSDFWSTPASKEEILESLGQELTTSSQVVLDYGDQDTLVSELLNIELTGVEVLSFG